MKTKYLPTLIVALLVVGCASLFNATVTITEVVNSAMTTWASMSVRGQTTPQIDARVRAVHGRYRQAAGVAAAALKRYQIDGDKAEYLKALEAVRVAAYGILDIITPLLTASEGQSLRTKLEGASKL